MRSKLKIVQNFRSAFTGIEGYVTENNFMYTGIFWIVTILFFLWGKILLGNFARLFWPLWIAYGDMIFNYMALVIAKTIVKSTIHE